MSLFRRLATAALVALLLTSLAVPNAHAVTIDWVSVGDPGNTADPLTGYGAVDEAFRIGKYEVTIQQYTDFLNAVAKSDPYSLYDTNMAADLRIAGISRSGSNGSYEYSVIGPFGTSLPGASSPGNRPIAYVSWFSAARFANWMQNGQGSGSTETGAYTLVGGQTSGLAPARNSGSTFFIPTEDQWYKAAYYSPVLNSGSGGYYTYATKSNTAPGNTVGDGVNQVNYAPSNVFSATQSNSYSVSQNYLTDVGAFTNSASYYGTFDQNGNVYEWNDLSGAAGFSRALRGGGWTNIFTNDLSSSGRVPVLLRPDNVVFVSYGFRLAAVPEPSTYCMALAGLVCGGYSLFRRRKRSAT